MALLIASTLILSWGIHLFYCLSQVNAAYENPFLYFHILLQTYLYTGLFITAHDAMHGSISENKNINYFTGKICSFLFAGLSYKKLLLNHRNHHANPGSVKDPDFYSGSSNLFIWLAVFLKRYFTLSQFIVMALIYNLLKFVYPEISVVLFLVVPAFLSTFQLFFFGTYLPHRTPHTHDMTPHNSRTQKKNHVWAMVSCYFFGYHSEHHHHPKTPWWQMYKLK